MTTLNETAGTIVLCPSCQQRGKKVKPSTLHALLQEEYREDVLGCEPNAVDACGCTPPESNTGYRFCNSSQCDVVYFSETTEQVFTKSQLRVTVGIKEKTGDRPLCYCFGHSVASIKDELLTKRRSDALDDIRQKMENPGCRCETENPSGSCCLGSVAQGIKTAQEELGMSDAVVVHASDATKSPSNRGETIAKVGTVVSAIIASSCCWLPLVLLAVGVSGAGIASTLDAYRPLFIVVTFSFLAAAFYFTYRPEKASADGGHDCCAGEGEIEEDKTCCSPATKGRPNMMAWNKVMLWAVTAMAVAFLLFPSYVGAFLGSDGSAMTASMNRTVLTIEGMTCEGCAASIAKSIRSVPGVVDVEVDFDSDKAVVATTGPVPAEQIIAAIETAGFEGELLGSIDNNADLDKKIK